MSLDDYRGRWLVLVFYPRDFSLVCPTELIGLSQRFDEFAGQGCDLLGITAAGRHKYFDGFEQNERAVSQSPIETRHGGLTNMTLLDWIFACCDRRGEEQLEALALTPGNRGRAADETGAAAPGLESTGNQ